MLRKLALGLAVSSLALAAGTAAAERFLLHDPCDWTEIEERARLIPVRMLEAERA